MILPFGLPVCKCKYTNYQTVNKKFLSEKSVYLYLFHQSDGEVEGETWTVKNRLCLVNDTMVGWRKNDNIRCIVVHALGEGDDVVSFYHKGVVFITFLLTCHLATVVIEQFQGVTNAVIKLTYFLEASDLFDASAFVLTWFECFKVKFRHCAYLCLHRCLDCRCDAIGNKDIWQISSAEGKKLLMFLGDADGELSVNILW